MKMNEWSSAARPAMVPSLATDNSGTAKNEVLEGSTMAAAGRDVNITEEAA